jgi:prodigiosin/undecylprodigiosin synthetase
MTPTASTARATESRPRIVTLDATAAAVADELGGKARHLADLAAAGFAVPPGFALTTSALEDFLDESGARLRLERVDATRRDGYRRARAIVEETPMPPRLRAAILDAYQRLGRPRVAVRSSAIGEDSASHSFAGQHDTFLDVDGDDALVDAVRRCWASLWSDRAWAYRRRDGAAGPLRMAVVVQEMVAADGAGVLFTIDPIGASPDHLVLEACWGLGEGLVSGRVSSDSYLIDRRTLVITRKQIRYKVSEAAAGEGGVALRKVPAERREAPVLDDAQAIALAREALRIAERYGADQDIEWAIRDGRIAILQSRPITTRPRRVTIVDPREGRGAAAVADRVLWSRMDIGEIFTGMMTPLGISFAKYYQHHVHRDCGKALGFHELGDPDEYMGYVQGHVYLNVSYTANLMAQSPPTRDQRRFTQRFTSEEVDLATYQNPYGAVPPGVDLRRSAAVWLKYLVTEVATSGRRARQMVASRFAEYDRFRALDLTAMSLPALERELAHDLEYFRAMHVGYMPYYINAFACYGILEELCKQLLGGEGVALQNRIKADMSNLRTIEGAREVWRVAQAARRSPRVRAIVEGTPADATATALHADPEGAAFWRDTLEPFFRTNGTRGRQEMELTHPRWVDDPSYVFQMVRNYLVNDVSIDDVLARSRRQRAVDSDELLRRVPVHHRALLRQVVRLYGAMSERREATRMSMITSIWLVRGVVYEVGRRLIEAGILRSLDEVAYLDVADVLAYLRGTRPASQCFPRAKIDEARQVHLYNLRTPEPPLTFIGRHDPTRQVVQHIDGEMIRGLGSSPGRVVGKARVVHELAQQADELQPDEILVAPFTDASWTPLFAIAAGVVTDIGSMLSHSSIVSRELSIPSVVNTKIATQTIRTGDTLMVDGDAGTVQILS